MAPAGVIFHVVLSRAGTPGSARRLLLRLRRSDGRRDRHFGERGRDWQSFAKERGIGRNAIPVVENCRQRGW